MSAAGQGRAWQEAQDREDQAIRAGILLATFMHGMDLTPPRTPDRPKHISRRDALPYRCGYRARLEQMTKEEK